MFFVTNIPAFVALYFLWFLWKNDREALNTNVKGAIKVALGILVFKLSLSVIYAANSIFNDVSIVDALPKYEIPFNSITEVFSVWWEDLFFAAPYLFLIRKYGWKKSLWALPLFVLTTAMFGLGHLYQGPSGWISVIYPAISIGYGLRYGLGTMMVFHVLYDVVVITCAYAHPYIIKFMYLMFG